MYVGTSPVPNARLAIRWLEEKGGWWDRAGGEGEFWWQPRRRVQGCPGLPQTEQWYRQVSRHARQARLPTYFAPLNVS
ncbi:hypothetical protein VTI28DRAFT_8844 [Corynascus sepedonium]